MINRGDPMKPISNEASWTDLIPSSPLSQILANGDQMLKLNQILIRWRQQNVVMSDSHGVLEFTDVFGDLDAEEIPDNQYSFLRELREAESSSPMSILPSNISRTGSSIGDVSLQYDTGALDFHHHSSYGHLSLNSYSPENESDMEEEEHSSNSSNESEGHVEPMPSRKRRFEVQSESLSSEESIDQQFTPSTMVSALTKLASLLTPSSIDQGKCFVPFKKARIEIESAEIISITSLPQELLERIFFFCNPKDLKNLLLVNNAYNKIIKNKHFEKRYKRSIDSLIAERWIDQNYEEHKIKIFGEHRPEDGRSATVRLFDDTILIYNSSRLYVVKEWWKGETCSVDRITFSRNPIEELQQLDNHLLLIATRNANGEDLNVMIFDPSLNEILITFQTKYCECLNTSQIALIDPDKSQLRLINIDSKGISTSTITSGHVEKYCPGRNKKNMSRLKQIQAISRHLLSYWNGDPDTKSFHVFDMNRQKELKSEIWANRIPKSGKQKGRRSQLKTKKHTKGGKAIITSCPMDEKTLLIKKNGGIYQVDLSKAPHAAEMICDVDSLIEQDAQYGQQKRDYNSSRDLSVNQKTRKAYVLKNHPFRLIQINLDERGMDALTQSTAEEVGKQNVLGKICHFVEHVLLNYNEGCPGTIHIWDVKNIPEHQGTLKFSAYGKVSFNRTKSVVASLNKNELTVCDFLSEYRF